jgi:hypothetical protein
LPVLLQGLKQECVNVSGGAVSTLGRNSLQLVVAGLVATLLVVVGMQHRPVPHEAGVCIGNCASG